MRRFWTLDEGMYFLNHGSFGATPAHVLEAQRDWQARMESQPVRFMTKTLPAALRDAADKLGRFLGTAGERIALVDNATTGVQAVLRSHAWRAGDELVIADHAYQAIRQGVAALAAQRGVRVVEAVIPYPLRRSEDIVEAYLAALSPRTRLVVLDHVFSPLALVTPVGQVIGACRQRRIPVLVDGAHAPGMLALDLDTLGADWYVGNCHKWLLSAKGCAFVYASAEAAAQVQPLVVSLNRGKGFPHEFDWQGTRDYSAWLSVSTAIDFLHALGVERYRTYLDRLAHEVAAKLADAWDIVLPAPAEAYAAMVTLPFPARVDGEANADVAQHWHDRLWQEHRIEVPVLAFNARLWLRLSAQVYNEPSDYLVLTDALKPAKG